MQHDRTVTSRNNFLFVENVPVFYWPVIKNDVEQSNFYIRQARFKSDHIFGQQFLVDWDAYQVFGLKRLPGTDWTFSTDYFTARGPAAGDGLSVEGLGIVRPRTVPTTVSSTPGASTTRESTRWAATA